jgi:hypothetical protein
MNLERPIHAKSLGNSHHSKRGNLCVRLKVGTYIATVLLWETVKLRVWVAVEQSKLVTI